MRADVQWRLTLRGLKIAVFCLRKNEVAMPPARLYPRLNKVAVCVASGALGLLAWQDAGK